MKRRARAWGIVWMTSQIGGAISPLLVLPIQAHFGWRTSFYFFSSWFHTYLVKGRGYGESDLWLSSLPYVVGAGANFGGGFASDWLVGRLGLKIGRRFLGIVGLGTAALCLVANTLTTSGALSLAFLSLAYGGMTLQQPVLCAVAVDIGRKHAGVVLGFGNTAAQAGSFVSSLVFGYLVQHFGSYSAPFVPMVALLAIGTYLWTQIDPTRLIFTQADSPAESDPK